MKIEIKNVLKLFAFLICLLPIWTWAASYEVSTSTKTVDGDTFCGGSACTSSDTIIIKGGARGGLKFQDFNGKGSYITITNENTNPDSKVEITSDGAGGFGVLSLSHCKYVDLRGNNDGDLKYGIHVINDDTPVHSGAIRVYGESDHIKLSYLEVDCTDNSTEAGIGIQTGDKSLTSAWTFDTFEIHHNYIHDTRYSGMYLGHNDPATVDDPYISNYSVHDNLMEDLGTYGMTMKGVHADSGVCLIYNNTIRRTGLVGSLGDNFKGGISISRFYGTTHANVYNNWIEKTIGAGIMIGDQNHNVYNNIIVGCGTGNDVDFGHGIITHWSTYGAHIYDNIIIHPKRYGIYVRGTTIGVTLSRNLIGDAGVGEWYEQYSGDATESAGDDANIHHADVAAFGFKTWSDDGNYSNDNFSILTLKPPSILKPPQALQTE